MNHEHLLPLYILYREATINNEFRPSWMVCFDGILDFSLLLIMHFQLCVSDILIGHIVRQED